SFDDANEPRHVRKISSAAVIARYGGSSTVIRSAIIHVLGQRSVVLKFSPPGLPPAPSLAGCDLAVLDWEIGFEKARRLIADLRPVAPRCVVVVYGHGAVRRDRATQAGADVCTKNGEFASLCRALQKAVSMRR